MQRNCNVLRHYEGKCSATCNSIYAGIELVALDKNQKKQSDKPSAKTQQERVDSDQNPNPPEEIGGPKGLEPTRYGDWERKGRCIDF